MSAPPGYELSTFSVTVGNDFDLDREYDDVPRGQAVASAWWTVKPLTALYQSDPTDASAVWKKTINATDAVGVGQIVASGAGDGRAILHWEGTQTESLLLTPGVEYVYDIDVVSTAGKKYTQERGMLVAYARTSQA